MDKVKKLQSDIVNLNNSIADSISEFPSDYETNLIQRYINVDDCKSIDETSLKILKDLDLKVESDKWSKADYYVVYSAAIIGSILDILITQTDVFKPVDDKIKELLKSDDIKGIQKKLDKWSNDFRNGGSAPIDFMGFDMAGRKSIHEQYSFGHDPLRFIEGIREFLTGNFRGIDKYGTLIDVEFGEAVPNLIQAILSYIAHMLSDLLNAQGIPYPGTTFLMQFGSDKVREDIAAAYRSGKFNFRTSVYQSLPTLIVSLIIHSYSIYNNYAQGKKKWLILGGEPKTQSMLLVANLIISSQNIAINSVRGVLGDAHALFRVNYPQIANTLKHVLIYMINEKKKLNKIKEKIDSIEDNVKSRELNLSTDLDDEFENFLKEY